MSECDYLFIHPLIGTHDTCSAFLIEIPPGSRIDASILNQLSQHEALEAFNKRQPWLFPLDTPLTWQGQASGQLVPILPAQPASSINEDDLHRFENELRQGNTKLALKASPSQKLPAASTWNYLLITASHARSLPPYSLPGLASQTSIIVTDVHNHADRAWADANACALTSSEFLLNPHPHGKKADLTRLKLLDLLALIAADADTAHIEDIFRQEAKLAYSLLRLVNAAAHAPRSPITSFSQAINLLGRRQLQRWLQLLVFAEQGNGQHANPLLHKAATRGRLIELLATRQAAGENEHFLDTAFMVGTFSLLDILLNMPMQEILQHLPLPALAQEALATHSGHLGKILQAVRTMESRNLASARQQLLDLAITPQEHLDAQLSALSWAAKIQPPV